MTTLRIGELASKGKVNLETVRYYEREGLMRVPQGTRSRHRAYALGDVLRLQFIKHSQALGFTLTEIKELFALKVTPNQPCIAVVHHIEAEVSHLRAIERTLRKMKASWEGRCAVSECPILDCLDPERPS